MPSIDSAPPFCAVHDGVSVLVVSKNGAESAVLKIQEEGADDFKTPEVPTPLPSSGIQGVALHGGAVAVWSAMQLEAYDLVRDASATITGARSLGSVSFASPPAAVALVGLSSAVVQQQPPETAKKAEEDVRDVNAVLCNTSTATIFVAVGTRIDVHRLRTASSDDLHQPSSCVAFTEREGRPTHLDVHLSLLAAATDKGCIKLFDVSQHPPRQLGSAGRLALPSRDGPSALALRSLRVNADGSWASLLVASRSMHGPGAYEEQEEEKREAGDAVTSLYLYDVDRDALVPYDFGGAASVTVEAHAWDARDPRLLACELRVRQSDGHIGEASSSSSGGGGVGVKREVATLFVAACPHDGGDDDKQGIRLLDRFPLRPPLRALVGVRVPRFYLSATGDEEQGRERLLRRTMRAFIGLDYDAMDEAAQAALRAFHSHLLRGDLSAAYRAGSSLRNPLVWENMARLCVRARRLDAAQLCLGKMGHARGLRAVREARADDASNGSNADALVPLAMAAVQLGMLDEAARLYHEARRPDLLLRLLVARGQWAEALRLVDDSGLDPLHRRRVHFEYAVHLEALGACEEAARHYEMAGAQHREAPRMLLQAHHGDPRALARYVASADDASSPALLRWWAAHCEAQRRFAEAKAAYRRAGAWSDLVRLACFEGDLAAAEAIIAELMDKQRPGQQRSAGAGTMTMAAAAACFRLAQHLEGQEHDVLRAIEYYAKAGCYNHCVRLARAHELDGEVMAYALKGPSSLMRDCARHFERRNQTPRALQLYIKARDWDAALRLCLRSLDKEQQEKAPAKPPGRSSSSSTSSQQQQQQQTRAAALLDAAREIAQGILLAADDTSGEQQHDPTAVSPDKVNRLARLLERRGRPHEAVRLHLLRLSRYNAHHQTPFSSDAASPPMALARRVLRLCLTHEVPLTEGMIDHILTATATTASESKEDSSGDGGGRASLLREAAEVCAAQGAHASASRLFTQAGDRRKGLLSLFALGDADGIVRYTGAARSPELFLLAAQHLRESGAWKRDEQTRAAVAEFLRRGKAEEAVVRAFEEESGRCRMLMKPV